MRSELPGSTRIIPVVFAGVFNFSPTLALSGPLAINDLKYQVKIRLAEEVPRLMLQAG